MSKDSIEIQSLTEGFTGIQFPTWSHNLRTNITTSQFTLSNWRVVHAQICNSTCSLYGNLMGSSNGVFRVRVWGETKNNNCGKHTFKFFPPPVIIFCFCAKQNGHSQISGRLCPSRKTYKDFSKCLWRKLIWMKENEWGNHFWGKPMSRKATCLFELYWLSSLQCVKVNNLKLHRWCNVWCNSRPSLPLFLWHGVGVFKPSQF